MKKILFLFVIIFILASPTAISMLLPNDYPDAVISIELCNESEKQCRSIATGFLVGFESGRKDENGNNLYHYFLVTNRHVFEGLNKVYLKFNHHTQGTKHYPIELIQNNKPIWRMHRDPSVDVAILHLNIPYLKGDQSSYKYFIDKDFIAYHDKFPELGISLGDEVFILGFPLGLVEQDKKFVIVKSGTIARLDEIVLKDEKGNPLKGFLIDSSIFPGNSGGPVIIKPTNVTLSTTKAVNFPYVIGIISSYIPYKTENSGLTLV